MNTRLYLLYISKQTNFYPSVIKNNLLVGHWNCRSINNKKLIFSKFLRDNQFDIFCLNETKLDNTNKRIFEMNNYNIVTKNRNRHGGGVAILIKNNLKFNLIHELIDSDFEMVGVNVKLALTSINIISFYLPPDNQKNKVRNQLSNELFDKLDKLKPYILVGDLNCHNTSWFCNKTSLKGSQLNDLIHDFDLSVINNKNPTFCCSHSNSNSVIDLMIISNQLCDKLNKFKVHPNDMLSDHFPISGEFRIKTNKLANPDVTYFNRVDWKEYTKLLDIELERNNGDTSCLEND